MLPTHAKGRPAGNGLQSAFDKGMNMAGLKATKTGGNDKERAYVVRQNWVLKTVLLLIVIGCIGCMILFSTVLKVSVTRREAMKAEKIHHQLEHTAQVKLMRAHLELQRALEQEVHETSRLEEFRSIVDRAIGDHSVEVLKMLRAKGITEDIMKQVEQSDERLREGLDQKMHKILTHFHGVAASARTSLKRVAHAIVSDVELEKKETDRYKEKMREEFGVDVDDDQDRKDMHEKQDEYGLFEEEHEGDDDNEMDGDEKEIEAELEKFFQKLLAHQFPLLDKEVIEKWEKDMTEINKILDDETRDTDLASIEKRVMSSVLQHAPKVEPFNQNKHSSIVDYYEMRIEEAKLAFHRQTLLDLYNGWKSDGKISPYAVLAGVESIAEENSMYLLYEWLDGEEGDEDDDGRDHK